MKKFKVGCCITSHGWGHAARVCAVMEQMYQLVPVDSVFVTQVPEFFFEESLGKPVNYHFLQTDVGFVQASCLDEDLGRTRAALDSFYPLSSERVDTCATFFEECDIIVCDIAPLGILAAGKLGVPSVLIENFTWDWIYEAYLQKCPELKSHRKYLQHVFDQADYHIQTQPVCYPGQADLIVGPVARSLRGSAGRIRKELTGDVYNHLILLTMGGGGRSEIALEIAGQFPECLFLTPGYVHTEHPSNVMALPTSSTYYHPDLIAAVDIVIGKVGYSTTAEIVQAGKPFGYVDRPLFPESTHLIRYIEKHLQATRVSSDALRTGSWSEQLAWLLEQSRQSHSPVICNGAETIAAFLLDLQI